MFLTTLDLSRRGPVLTVRIVNPAGDLLDASVMADLDLLGRCLARDKNVRAVVITGPRPGTFIPHYDIAEILQGSEEFGVATPYPVARAALTAVGALNALPGARGVLARTPAAGLVQILQTHAALSRLGRLSQVVIAAIDGDAQGGGCEVAMACDIRVITDADVRIGLPEISAGIMPGAGGTARLAQSVGAHRALSMVLQARTLGPQEALAAGLVDEVSADPLQRAHHIAERVAEWNPEAVRNTKRAMARPRSLRTEAAGFVATVSQDRALEGLRRFVAAPVSPWQDRTLTRDDQPSQR